MHRSQLFLLMCCLVTLLFGCKSKSPEELLPAPLFSLPGRVMTDTCQVTIFMPEGVPQDTRLYITTDGSEPKSTSASYEQQTFVITSTTILRAKLISSHAVSPTATHSYIFHHCATRLPIVSIACDDPDDYSHPVNVEFFHTADSTTWFNQLCSMGAFGQVSREQAQKSVKITARKRYGKKYLKGQFWSDKPHVTKVRSFVLRNGGNCCAFGRINDAYVQRLFGRHLPNLDYQSYEPAILYVNGSYRGVYGLRERLNEDYVKANYGIDTDSIYMADHLAYLNDAKQRRKSTFDEVYDLYQLPATTYDQMAQVIDVDNFMKTLIVEMFASNTDFPLNNIAMWRRREPGSKWRWIVKDLDRYNFGEESDFDSFEYMFGSETDSTYAYYYSHYPDIVEGQKIYRKMFSYPQFREAFIDAYATYLGDFLKPSVTIAMLAEMVGEIDEEMKQTASLYNQEIYGEIKGLSYEKFRHFSTLGLGQGTLDRVANVYAQMAKHFNLGFVFKLTVLPGSMHLCINDVPLTTDYFDGAYFTGRDLRLSTDNHCSGWRLQAFEHGELRTMVELVDSNPTITFNSFAACDSISLVAY